MKPLAGWGVNDRVAIFLGVAAGAVLLFALWHAVERALGTFVRVARGEGWVVWRAWTLLGLSYRVELDDERVRVSRSILAGLVPIGRAQARLSEFRRVALAMAERADLLLADTVRLGSDGRADAARMHYRLSLLGPGRQAFVVFQGSETRDRGELEDHVLALRRDLEARLVEQVPPPVAAPAAVDAPAPDERVRSVAASVSPPPAGRVVTKRIVTPMEAPTAAGGAAPDGRREFVLVTFPAAGPPSPEQEQALMTELGLGAYEARIRLGEPLPRLAATGAPEELRLRRLALEQAGVDALVLDAAEVALEPREVLGVVFDWPWLHLAGAWGEVRIDLDRPALAVAGKLLWSASGTGTSTTYEGRDKVTTITTARGAESTFFVHLYAGAGGPALALTEKSIQAWDFLGAEKTFAARTNFQLLSAALRARTGVTWDDRLQRHAEALGRTVDASRRASPGVNLYSRSNDAAAAAMSRVLYHAWRGRCGLAPDALAPCEILATPSGEVP